MRKERIFVHQKKTQLWMRFELRQKSDNMLFPHQREESTRHPTWIHEFIRIDTHICVHDITNWRLNFMRHKNLWNSQSEKVGHELIVAASKGKKFNPNAEIISANKIENIQYAYKINIRKVLYDDFTLLKENIHSNCQDWSDDISIKRVYSVKALGENLCKARYVKNFEAGDGAAIEMPTDFIKSNCFVDAILIKYTWSLSLTHQNSLSDRDVFFRICGN